MNILIVTLAFISLALVGFGLLKVAKVAGIAIGNFVCHTASHANSAVVNQSQASTKDLAN